MDDEGVRSWFTFPVLLPEGTDRAKVIRGLDAAGIETADYFPAVQTLPGYCERVRSHGSLAVSTMLGERLLCLPFWSGLDEIVMTQVVGALTAELAQP
jgi:dTDP-4-amino-4,6-dideoxygalactose transaminase